MPIKSQIVDGRFGDSRKLAISSDGALFVTQVPRNLGDLTNEQKTRVRFNNSLFTNSSGSSSLNVNGSVTPVEFLIRPPKGMVISLEEVRFRFEGGDLDMGTNDIRKFGTAAGTGGLTNGLEFFIVQNGTQTNIFIDPIQHMSGFINYTVPEGPLNFPDGIAVNQDILTWVINFKPNITIPVVAGGTDRVVVRVNDNLTAINLFQVTGSGALESIKPNLEDIP